jgi:DNA-binding transcriptional regulator YhcF (GntR family)
MVQSKAHRKEKNSAEIARILEGKIREGVYPEGSRLSTVRELAAELRVNKNTVARAYQSLKKKGYLELVRGSGAFVRRREPIPENGNGHWEEQVERIVEDAKRRAMNREDLLRVLRQSVDRVYWQDNLRLAFIECNDEDIQSMTAELRTATGHPLSGILLSDFSARPQEIATQFDLIVTTFFHLSQVTSALEPTAQQIVGVNVIPNHDALLNITRLKMPVIGLVCAMPSVVDTLTHIIQTYHPKATVIPALIDDRTRLDTLFEKADAIVVTRGFAQKLLTLKPKVPVIPVEFSIEKQSIDFLERRIQELGIAQSKTPSAVR